MLFPDRRMLAAIKTEIFFNEIEIFPIGWVQAKQGKLINFN